MASITVLMQAPSLSRVSLQTCHPDARIIVSGDGRLCFVSVACSLRCKETCPVLGLGNMGGEMLTPLSKHSGVEWLDSQLCELGQDTHSVGLTLPFSCEKGGYYHGSRRLWWPVRERSLSASYQGARITQVDAQSVRTFVLFTLRGSTSATLCLCRGAGWQPPCI